MCPSHTDRGQNPVHLVAMILCVFGGGGGGVIFRGYLFRGYFLLSVLVQRSPKEMNGSDEVKEKGDGTKGREGRNGKERIIDGAV